MSFKSHLTGPPPAGSSSSAGPGTRSSTAVDGRDTGTAALPEDIASLSHSFFFGDDGVLGRDFLDEFNIEILPNSFLAVAQKGKTAISSALARTCVTHAHTGTTLRIDDDKDFIATSPYVSSISGPALKHALLDQFKKLNPLDPVTRAPTMSAHERLEQLAVSQVGGFLAVVQYWDPEDDSPKYRAPIIQVLAAPAIPPLATGTADSELFGWNLGSIWNEDDLDQDHPPFKDFPKLICPIMVTNTGFTREIHQQSRDSDKYDDPYAFETMLNLSNALWIPDGVRAAGTIQGLPPDQSVYRVIYLPGISNLPVGMAWPLETSAEILIQSIVALTDCQSAFQSRCVPLLQAILKTHLVPWLHAVQTHPDRMTIATVAFDKLENYFPPPTPTEWTRRFDNVSGVIEPIFLDPFIDLRFAFVQNLYLDAIATSGDFVQEDRKFTVRFIRRVHPAIRGANTFLATKFVTEKCPGMLFVFHPSRWSTSTPLFDSYQRPELHSSIVVTQHDRILVDMDDLSNPVASLSYRQDRKPKSTLPIQTTPQPSVPTSTTAQVLPLCFLVSSFYDASLLIASSISFGLSVFSIADCSFIRKYGTSNRSRRMLLYFVAHGGGQFVLTIDDLGLFGYSGGFSGGFSGHNGEVDVDAPDCTVYPDEVMKENEVFDSEMRTARTFGVIAAIATGLIVIYFALRLKFNFFDSRRFYLLLFLYGVALLSQSLTFRVSYSAMDPRNEEYSDSEYALGPAGICAAVNVGFLAIAFLRVAWNICDASLLASGTSFALSAFSVGHCSFKRDWSKASGGLGLFGYWNNPHSRNAGCMAYPRGFMDESFDSAMRAARAFGVIAAISTGLAVIYCALRPKFYYDSRRFILLLLYGVALLSQSLTFLFFASDMDPRDDHSGYLGFSGDAGGKLGPAGIGAAVNVVLLLIVFLLVARTIRVEAP